jgi:hypothetical protein
MSLNPRPIAPVPPETARVARAAFPNGNRYMTIQVHRVVGHFRASEAKLSASHAPGAARVSA